MALDKRSPARGKLYFICPAYKGSRILSVSTLTHAAIEREKGAGVVVLYEFHSKVWSIKIANYEKTDLGFAFSGAMSQSAPRDVWDLNMQ